MHSDKDRMRCDQNANSRKDSDILKTRSLPTQPVSQASSCGGGDVSLSFSLSRSLLGAYAIALVSFCCCGGSVSSFSHLPPSSDVNHY